MSGIRGALRPLRQAVVGLAGLVRRWFARAMVLANPIRVREFGLDNADVFQRKFKAPGAGPNTHDLERLARGEIGIAVAWIGSRPIGVGFVQWSGPRHRELFGRWDGVPEIYRLHVVRAYRSVGVGSTLINFLERDAARRGCARIGLGIHLDNRRARDLYGRLGYQHCQADFVDQYTTVLPGGETKEVRQPSVFLVREITR
jgi:GNAT superfamily N-acetyltransferase